MSIAHSGAFSNSDGPFLFSSFLTDLFVCPQGHFSGANINAALHNSASRDLRRRVVFRLPVPIQHRAKVLKNPNVTTPKRTLSSQKRKPRRSLPAPNHPPRVLPPTNPLQPHDIKLGEQHLARQFRRIDVRFSTLGVPREGEGEDLGVVVRVVRGSVEDEGFRAAEAVARQEGRGA